MRISKKARIGKTEEQPNALPAGSAKAVPIKGKIMRKIPPPLDDDELSPSDFREELARGGRDQWERFRT